MLSVLQHLKPNMKKIHLWVLNSLKILDVSRQASEYIFIILKLFAGIALFIIILTVMLQAVQDHGKISVKPFSVPENMQANHKAAGSIIANIIKQNLSHSRIEIDTTIQDSSSSNYHEREDTLLSNDTGFFKGENIKLPETSISINDVVEFISGIFGRKNITGSVYHDNGILYLQVEINGKIFTAERKLGQKNTNTLHIELIREMANDISRNVLHLISDKYRLYYSCTEDKIVTDPEFDLPEYQTLYQYCHRAKQNTCYLSRGNQHKAECGKITTTNLSLQDLKKLQKELEQSYPLSAADNDVEQYIVHFLSRRLSASTSVQKTILLSDNQPSLAEQIQISVTQKTARRAPNSNVASHLTELPPENAAILFAPMATVTAKVDRRLSQSTLLKLRTQCEMATKATVNASLANEYEQQAGVAYSDKKYQQAEQRYKEAINANCNNAYAWANLGILLSDLGNAVHFDPLDATVALQKASTLKPQAGWIWHSLCIAEAYAEKNKKFAEIINKNSCRRARSETPGKQLIYDKLLYIALAETWLDNDAKKAFEHYRKAIEIDPKRSCKLRSIIYQMDEIKADKNILQGQNIICTALKNSYPAADPDESCESALSDYQNQHCNQ